MTYPRPSPYTIAAFLAAVMPACVHLHQIHSGTVIFESAELAGPEPEVSAVSCTVRAERDAPTHSMLIAVLPPRQVYYYNKQAQRTEVRGCWCHSCWNEAKEGLVQLDGSTVPKKDLDKRKNDEEVRRPVACLRATNLDNSVWCGRKGKRLSA